MGVSLWARYPYRVQGFRDRLCSRAHRPLTPAAGNQAEAFSMVLLGGGGFLWRGTPAGKLPHERPHVGAFVQGYLAHKKIPNP